MDARALLWAGIFFLLFMLVGARARRRGETMPWIYVLFFCSGFPALIYQIVWQRALFAFYGVNVESVTIVVSAFMCGLGLGSLLGGALSKSSRLPLLALFAVAELGTAGFGLFSLKLFNRVALWTAGAPPLQTGLFSFLLVVFPTVMMGSTLPLLVEHMVRVSRNVGSAVGGMYFANTLGSAAACFVAGDVMMRSLGQSGSVEFAAAINVLVGAGVLIYSICWERRSARTPSAPPEFAAPSSKPVLSFPVSLACAAFAGFLALAYEIVWYRLLAFASGGLARVFAFLLGSYLLGVALGSRLVERYAARPHAPREALQRLAWIFFASSIASFGAGPLYAYLLHFGSGYSLGGDFIPAYLIFLPIIAVGALFFGATFPLVSHVAVGSGESAGARLSYLYAANIAGSTLGSFLVGFVLMDHFSIGAVSTFLLTAGVALSFLLLRAAGAFAAENRMKLAAAGLCAVALAAATQPVLRTIYDRLFFKQRFPAKQFERVVESHSGVVAVTADGVLYGGGAYDGHFSVDLCHDINMIVRPYALSAMHAAPRRVLMIGLGSGSWAQVVANNPDVEDLTIVEINAGYLALIRQSPVVSSLLSNPRAHIVVDDGRRWMQHNAGQKYDAIVMNTTLHWRDHASSLLSVEFLQLVRRHLRPGGIAFYNTTDSNEVLATAVSVFPYALRVENSVAVSDSPINFDRNRWRQNLLRYRIDGRPVIDTANQQQMLHLDEVLSIPDDPSGHQGFSIEENNELRRRLQHQPIITDDNMLLEWRA